MDKSEIEKHLYAYYNLCMDKYRGWVSEEALLEYLESLEHETDSQ